MTAPGAGGPFRISRRPPTIIPATDLAGVVVVKRRDLMMLTDGRGDIRPDPHGLGLYRGDTRILSRYELRLNGERPVALRSGGAEAEVLQLTNLDLPDLPRQSLGLRRERLLSNVFHERITVRNFTTDVVRCELTLTLEADAADLFEVRGLERDARGEWLPVLVAAERVCFRYRGRDGVLRRTHLAFSEPVAATDGSSGGVEGPLVEVDWRLPGGAERHLEVTVWADEVADRPADGAAVEAETANRAEEVAGRTAEDSGHDADADGLAALRISVPALDRMGPERDRQAWEAEATRFVADEPGVQRALDRAARDMQLLLNEGPEPGERYIAAGIPWYATLFGRDALITAYELLPVNPALAADTLRVLARLQSSVDDPRRDAEPGRILHELRTGELARTGEIPHTPYYGTIDATPLWLILLGETYRWTADHDLVEELWPSVRAAVGWLDAQSALRSDGFLAYLRRSSGGEASRGWGGLPNQGWKDSWDSARRRDGSLAQGSVALAEVQGYVHAARLAVAALARVLGDAEFAAAQERRAEELRASFEMAFWMEDAGTYALGLDGEGEQVDAVSSNAGQALWGGIAAPERAERVAASLLGPGMWSGWGVRTLSSETGGYNPIGYHTGSVWPHDNALIAAGLVRYGHAELAARIAGALLEAARYFPDDRLPELFCGFDRAEAPLPVPYPVACSPQAWSAGSPFLFISTLLGLSPDAAAGRLELRRPHLPPWLPAVRLLGLRVGGARVDLSVTRTETAVAVEVTPRGGTLDVVLRG